MGLADVLNSMQNDPSGQRAFGSGGGGMSPLTMALLGLLAYKAVKSFAGGQPSAASAGPGAPAGGNIGAPGTEPNVAGSLGDLLKGRDDSLAALRAQLTGDGAAAITQTEVISGLGGVGKTRLAVEYAWRHIDDYDAVLFVLADSPDSLHANIAALTASKILDLPEKGEKEQDAQIAGVYRWLASHADWLLILDNVDTVCVYI